MPNPDQLAKILEFSGTLRIQLIDRITLEADSSNQTNEDTNRNKINELGKVYYATMENDEVSFVAMIPWFVMMTLYLVVLNRVTDSSLFQINT